MLLGRCSSDSCRKQERLVVDCNSCESTAWYGLYLGVKLNPHLLHTSEVMSMLKYSSDLGWLANISHYHGARMGTSARHEILNTTPYEVLIQITSTSPTVKHITILYLTQTSNIREQYRPQDNASSARDEQKSACARH